MKMGIYVYEKWGSKAMKIISRISCCLAFLGLFASGLLVAHEKDVEGSKDHPLFNRMPSFYIHQYEEKEFDSHDFIVNNNSVAVGGHFYHNLYYPQPGMTEPSRTQILRNYENAIRNVGGAARPGGFQ